MDQTNQILNTMAASNFFQAQKALLFVSLTFFLLLLSRVSLAEKEIVSFSFPRFVPGNQRNLTLQADAVLSFTQTGQIRLTNSRGSIGRALYSDPIHIWDRRSGNVASFVTSFSFVITADPNGRTADGLAFFLGPVDTQPKEGGGLLGLFENDKYDKSNQIVAVEFDTWPNPEWDPPTRHIGVDVNSIRSTKTTEWGAFTDRTVADVDISYQASSKILNVSLNYPVSGKSFILADVVDLTDILPEQVRVGFSASTGKEGEIHDIVSWSFHSELPISTSTEAFMNEAHLSSFVQRV